MALACSPHHLRVRHFHLVRQMSQLHISAPHCIVSLLRDLINALKLCTRLLCVLESAVISRSSHASAAHRQ